MLCFGEAELKGRNVHDVLHQARPNGHGPEACPILAAIGSSQTVRDPDDVVWRRDGEPVPVQWTLEPLIKGAAVKGAVLTLTDMSDIHRAQEELRQAVRARDEVVAVVSHDLRNPLGTIAAAAGLMLELELPPEKRRDHLRIIGRATERMNHLIGDLLDVARIESGGLSVHKEVLDIQSLLEEAVELLEPLAQERGLGLHCQVDPHVRAVFADRDRVLQVLSNLVGNAVKFSRGGSVGITVARGAGGTTVFSVRDTGPGIPPDAAEHLFDRFWRQNQADRHGAGLGLAIVKGIVLAHGGDVWVESRMDEGSTFFFSVPPAPEQTRAELAAVATELRR
jgi:signal transduction histidine kinase